METCYTAGIPLTLVLVGITISPTNAQLIPDQSLNQESSSVSPQVVNGLPSDVIQGGAIRGSNLFHSFDKLNVIRNRGAYFANPINIKNIISRVTGENKSNISGNLGVLGSANLFLMNPNGIIFGPGGKLDINGSFLATTADTLLFSNNFEFNAIRQKLPSIEIGFPSGLKFDSPATSIEVNGIGHTLENNPAIGNVSIPSKGAGLSNTGLRSKPNQTVALIGGNIHFNGGIVTSPEGYIKIGSVELGEVTFNSTSNNWDFNYKDSIGFGDIQFINSSLLDASGLEKGDIHVQGKQLTISDGSFFLIQNQGLLPAGNIKIDATDTINILGSTVEMPASTLQAGAGIISETIQGEAADIFINSPNLFLTNGGFVISSILLEGQGADINLNIPKLLKVSGPSQQFPLTNFTSITNFSLSNSQSGNTTVSTQNLVVEDGASLSTLSIGNSEGGDLIINASESIDILGFNPVSGLSSQLVTSTVGIGTAGDLLINTKRLNIFNGAFVGSVTVGEGPSGVVKINASEFIDIKGRGFNNFIPSSISSSANVQIAEIAEAFQIPLSPTGDSKSISVSTNNLRIRDGGQIAVSNDGSGDAGNLNIFANSIHIENSGAISARTNGGNGGNIQVFTNSLLLRNSILSASAMGDGAGGNITINADLVVALDKSNFSANAQNAQGGNVRIDATGIILSPDSKVTATSQLGPQFDGSVEVDAEITNLSQDPDLNIQVDPPELYSACSDTYRDTLAYYHVGTAGRPTSPITRTPADGGWLKAAKARYDQRRLTYIDPESGEIKPLKRVVGSKKNKNGTITLVTDPREADQYAPAMSAQLKACQTEQAKAS